MLEVLKIRLLNKPFNNDFDLLRYCLNCCLEFNLGPKEANLLYNFKKKLK